MPRPNHQGDLDRIREDFEGGFQKILGPPPEIPPISLSFAGTNPPSPEADAVSMLHHEVGGFGETFEEALQDWQTELAKRPQSGQILYWRVLPEIASDFDFATQKRAWKVYARFGVLK
jgi:hypothetical protein